MPKPFEIQKPNQYTLRIEKSRIASIFGVIGFIVFFGFWYGMLLYGFGKQDGISNPVEIIKALTSKQPFMWLFILAPLTSLPSIVKAIKIALLGENFVFDSTDKQIYKDGGRLSPFNEIQKVHIRRISGDGADEFLLSLVPQTGRKIKIQKSKEEDLLYEAADAIADILNVEVEKKG